MEGLTVDQDRFLYKETDKHERHASASLPTSQHEEARPGQLKRRRRIFHRRGRLSFCHKMKKKAPRPKGLKDPLQEEGASIRSPRDISQLG